MQIQEALWRNEEFNISKEVKENALEQEGKSCRAETITAENQYACHDLSVWNKRQKIKFAQSKRSLPVREKIIH